MSPTDFVIPPQNEVAVRVTYTPVAAGTYTAERLDFLTPGGNRPRVLLTAAAAGPVVRVAKQEDPFAQGHGVPNSVNFGSVKVAVVER